MQNQKYLTYNNKKCFRYFWRTTQQQEIDYIEEMNGQLFAWEFKWQKHEKARIPLTFRNAYPDTITDIIDKENYPSFLGL